MSQRWTGSARPLFIGASAVLSACGAPSSGPTDPVGIGGTAGSSHGGSLSTAGNSAAGNVAATGGSGSGASAVEGGTAGAAVRGSGGLGGNAGGAPSAGAAGSAGSNAGGAGGQEITIVPDPSWTCGRPNGLVPPARGKLVLSATLELGETHSVGKTPFGERRLIDVKGGELTGEGERQGLSATFLSGGLELELTLDGGALELEQIDVLRATDGSLIYLRSCGVAPSGGGPSRLVPDFEVATSSPLAWLNDAELVGTREVDGAGKQLTVRFYDVKGVEPTEPRVKLQDPAGVPNQAWECATGAGSRGASVFTETVTLGGSLSVGASKRGTRNIIPITGGTTSGRVTGSVLPGGADYQLLGGTTKLDARYTLSTNDDELILVRNCGAFGALIPTFEARAAGPYAFLNENAFSSSDPGSAAGGVSITFYERK